jgi:hypothetical protein
MPLRLVVCALLLCAMPLLHAEDPVRPYALEGTEVRTLHAAKLQRDYELYVALPASYAGSPQRRYPVVFVTDAGYGFPLLRAIGRHVSHHNPREMDEFILVGLGYAKGETPQYSRRRDYTPTAQGDADAVSDMPGRVPVFGEAEAYRRFVADDVFPFIASRYRADMARKVLAGQSYGALWATHVLLSEPAMFQHYLIASPSLWFGRRAMFERERAYAAGHRELKAQVFVAVGGYEAVNPKSGDARYNRDVDMVADLQAFVRALQSHGYAGLQLRSRVYREEDHLSLPPVFFTHGLLWALAPQGKAR